MGQSQKTQDSTFSREKVTRLRTGDITCKTLKCVQLNKPSGAQGERSPVPTCTEDPRMTATDPFRRAADESISKRGLTVGSDRRLAQGKLSSKS